MREFRTHARRVDEVLEPVDARILDLTASRIPDKEPTVYHITQVRRVLAACNTGGPGGRRAAVVSGAGWTPTTCSRPSTRARRPTGWAASLSTPVLPPAPRSRDR